MAKKRESTPGENLAKQIIEQYNPKSVADISDDTDKLEDFNNKIKVAKRIGYGYLDSLSFYSFCLFTITKNLDEGLLINSENDNKAVSVEWDGKNIVL
ncbi:hypothetical protein [Ruminococcus intestinalis]|uniref:hypothetical protein n=1 Tax=Ruminococcus intestinalis TaxID=2763066 RepID=UPI003F7E5288